MSTLEVVPDKSQYYVGDPIVLECTLTNTSDFEGEWWYECEIVSINKVIATGKGRCSGRVPFKIDVRDDTINGIRGGYGAFVTATLPDGRTVSGETAFDVVLHWREAPRYGFLSDFGRKEAGQLGDVEFLRKMHINIVQFYDWMYRHDQLLAGQDEFVDPLGRSLSHAVVREKISALQERGIHPIAYAAVYASLADYAERYPEQVLYQNNGFPHSLAELFFIMDISVGSDWTHHILEEFKSVITDMEFEGLHLDQYGMPKQAIRRIAGKREVVKLNKLYPEFIDFLRTELGENVGLIFNNVSNYPTHTTARAKQDIVYIEVWDPASRLRDLKQLISDARNASHKQVILAAYLPAFRPDKLAEVQQAEVGAILTMATIFASAGYHLLIGEFNNILADPYYPKYGQASPTFQDILQRYYNFIVMYRDALFSLDLVDVSMSYTGGINTDVVFRKEGVRFTPSEELGVVWTFVKEKDDALILHLVNLVGVDNDLWYDPKATSPTLLDKIEVDVELWQQIEGIYWASPDNETMRSQKLIYSVLPRGKEGGDYIRFVIPRLMYWSTVYIKMQSGVPIDLKQS